MKAMQVSLNIDVANIEHVEALEVFMRTLGGHPFQTTVTGPTATPDIKVEKAEDSAVDKVAAEKAARAAARKAKADKLKAEAEAEAAAAAAEAENEEEDDDLVGDDEEEEITVATLRTLTAEKSATHRAEIKAKLVELGASNVTTMDVKHYKAYYDFITKL